jgi:hypothetical protein
MLPDDIDKRRMGAPGIVEIGDAVAETRTKMEQGHGRLSLHPAESVSRAGADTLEQPENGLDARYPIEGDNDRQLGCAGVGKTYLDPTVDGSLDKRFSSVHFILTS